MNRLLFTAGALFLLGGSTLGIATEQGLFRIETESTIGAVVGAGLYKFEHRNEIYTGSLNRPGEVGSSVRVLYNPRNPSSHHAEEKRDVMLDPRSKRVAVAAVFVVAIGIGFFVGAATFRKGGREGRSS
jgi:hypothetical protein